MGETGALLDVPGLNGYRIRVQPYLLGQKRIQLIDEKKPDYLAEGEGQIVREMCTYDVVRAALIVKQLAESQEPEALAETFAKPWNCEGKGGRIRLDNRPGDIHG